MKAKATLVIIAVAVVAITGILIFSGMGKGSGNNQVTPTAENVSMVDGKQVITVNVKGGYLPRATAAKANTPTVIKFVTKNTFDCSSSVTIPSLKYEKNLQPSGETLVDVPPQQAGSSLNGLCSMGMYSFKINFN